MTIRGERLPTSASGPESHAGGRTVANTDKGTGGVSEERDGTGGGIGVRCEGVVHLYRTFEGHDVVALRASTSRSCPVSGSRSWAPRGSGKSTLLTLLGGIQKPSAGRIFLGDEEISRMGERYLARVRARRVSTMLQGATRNLLPYATARQNIGFARLGMEPSMRRTATADRDLLGRVGLEAQVDQIVSTMSGGQRQRLALACAVSTGPQLLLADEPTSQLSHEDRDHVLELIHGLGDDLGTTVVVVTHQPEVAETFPRTVTMKGGRVGAEGRDGSEYVVIGAEGVAPPADPLRRPSGRRARWCASSPRTTSGWSCPGRGHAGEEAGRSTMSDLEVHDITYVVGRTLLDDVDADVPRR